MNWIINNMWWGVYFVTMVWFICLWTILRFSLGTLWELFVKQERRGDCFKEFLDKGHAIKILDRFVNFVVDSICTIFNLYISFLFTFIWI